MDIPFLLVGEFSEGNDLYQEMSEAGVINQDDISKSKVALVASQMNEPWCPHALPYLVCQ